MSDYRPRRDAMSLVEATALIMWGIAEAQKLAREWWVVDRDPLIFRGTSGIPLRVCGQAARATLRHAHHSNPHVWVEATA